MPEDKRIRHDKLLTNQLLNDLRQSTGGPEGHQKVEEALKKLDKKRVRNAAVRIRGERWLSREIRKAQKRLGTEPIEA